MIRSTLPPLLGHAFSTRDALAEGVTPSRLRARDLETPFRGVRTRLSPPQLRRDDERGGERDRVRELAVAYAMVMPPHQFFSHATAAILWGMPMPPRSSMVDTGAHVLDVCVLHPSRTPRVAGIRGHQVRPALASVSEVGGLRATSPASTFAMLGSLVGDVRDLVALGDAAVRVPMFQGDHPALATISDLGRAVRAGRRMGITRLEEALSLVRTRSAFSPESRCRVELLRAGLPEPELNVDVFDERGRRLACVDLAYPTQRIAIEYEGEHHLVDPRQWAKDIERHARLVDAGWIVIRVTRVQLFQDPQSLADRVRRALALRS